MRTFSRSYLFPNAVTALLAQIAAAGGGGPAWRDLTPPPGLRQNHAMAFDSRRGVTVFYGGGQFEEEASETWEWNGDEWIMRPISGPPALAGHAMAYDSARGVTLLFGGFSYWYQGGTWEFNGSDWALRATTGPSPRYRHALTFDSTREVVVLVGGEDAAGACQDIWEWDGVTWTLRIPTTSWLLRDHAMAYDSARGTSVIFGGFDPPNHLNTLFEWDGSTWAHGLGIPPSARWGHAMAFDELRGVAVLVGGRAADNSPFGDTWTHDGNTWTLESTTGPSPRYDHAMVYDSLRGVTVLYGGAAGGGETWEWDGTTWSLRDTTGPGQRYAHALAHDSARGKTVMFSGATAAPNRETWEWDGYSWTLRSTAGPPALSSHAMVFDVDRNVSVLFGGVRTTGLSAQTWEWDGTSWILAGTAGPSARGGHAMSFDSGRGVVVLYGGDRGYAEPLLTAETWERTAQSWTLRATGGPSPRRYHAMTYDAGRGVTVLFGGWRGGTPANWSSETWEWDGIAWSLRATAGPSPRERHAMAYDADRGVVVLFGGSGGSGPDDYYDDTWEWNGSVWSIRATPGPSRRRSHAMVYESTRGVMLLFGGRYGLFDGQTWELGCWRTDLDCDRDVDLADFEIVPACLTGPGVPPGGSLTPECDPADFDRDGDVDLGDFSDFHISNGFCGDGYCGTPENSCTCLGDCGQPPTLEQIGSTCNDSLDNDCDGAIDCDDADCVGDASCPICSGDGVCELIEDCENCPGDCAGLAIGPPSGRFCCGNGIPEPAEGDGTRCDGHP